MGKSKTVAFKESSSKAIENAFGGNDVAFNNIVNQAMEDVVKKQNFIAKYIQHLEFVSASSKGMVIRDNHLNGKLFEVSLRDNRLWCSEDKPKMCMHCTFTLLHLKTGSLEDQDEK